MYITTCCGQGRSCKQISWPPGIGGLQGVGLDPGQHDYHPHGLVHVGQLQDVQTVVPVIQEANLGLTTVSSSVRYAILLTVIVSTQGLGVTRSSKELGVAAAEAGNWLVWCLCS